MVIVLFRSRLRAEAGEEYASTAKRTLELAQAMPGFVSFKSFTAADDERVSIIEFESAEAVRAWYAHPEHLRAQQAGRTHFYEEYQIQVCEETRKYGFARDETH